MLPQNIHDADSDQAARLHRSHCFVGSPAEAAERARRGNRGVQGPDRLASRGHLHQGRVGCGVGGPSLEKQGLCRGGAGCALRKNLQWYGDSRIFWEKWIDFELQQPTSAEVESQHAERVQQLFEELRTKSRLSAAVKKDLSRHYYTYLLQRRGKDP